MKTDELEAHVAAAGIALQEIQDAHGRDNVPKARIRFPRGFVQPASAYRATLPNLGSEVQRSNAAYSLMTVETLRWLIVRTDVFGAILSGLAKEVICIWGAVSEWLTKEACHGHGKKVSFSKRAEKLVALGVIDAQLKDELIWLWGIRCREHLHEVDKLEHDLYSRADLNRAKRCFSSLCERLIAVHGRAD